MIKLGQNHYLQLPLGIEDYARAHDCSVDEVVLRACHLFLENERKLCEEPKEELPDKIQDFVGYISRFDRKFKEKYGVSLSTIGIASLIGLLEKK